MDRKKHRDLCGGVAGNVLLVFLLSDKLDAMVSSVLVILFIMIIWCTYWEYNEPHHDYHIEMTEHKWRDADIVFFKSYTNLLAPRIASHVTHVGIVILVDGIPYILEADKPTDDNPRGIYFTRLKERILTYKGIVYIRRIEKKITTEQRDALCKFALFASDNLTYTLPTWKRGIKRILHNHLTTETNCAELVYLAMFAMGIIDPKVADQYILRYLNFLLEFTPITNSYSPLCKVLGYNYKDHHRDIHQVGFD